MEDETIFCRCEDVTWGEIRRHLQNGWTDPEEIKRLTRAGMGRCQGLTCRDLILTEIARFRGLSPSQVSPPSFRPPAGPVPLGVIAGGDAEDE